MCCKSFWTRVVPFVLTLVFGLLTVSIFQEQNPANKNQENLKSTNQVIYPQTGSGKSGRDTGKSFDAPVESESLAVSRSETKPIQIISKPRAYYTDAARQNQVQGTLTLRVVFMANGEIGSISPVTNLPDGLTEQAIAAAKEIKFEPSKKNGVSQTVTKQVQYSFTIY